MTSTPLANVNDSVNPASTFETVMPDSDLMDPGMGVDTITFSAIPPDDPGMGADTITFSATTTSWGEGDGLNGDILRPENTDSLSDILDNVTFDATIYSDNYLSNSNLRASVNAFDQDGNYLFEQNIHNYAAQNSSSTTVGGSQNRDEIHVSANTTDVYYANSLSNSWEKRQLLRSIGNLAPVSGGNVTTTETEDSTYLFIRPDSIENRGVIDYTYNSDTNYNPEDKSFNTLSTSAPLAIEISNDIATELRDEIADLNIDLDSSSFNRVSTDFGHENNITIKLSDYQDVNGNIDVNSLNSDLRFTLELNTDAAEKVTSRHDNAWANAEFRTDDGNSRYLNLNARDHDLNAVPDHEYISAGGSVTDFLEDAGTDSTIFELGFNGGSFDHLQHYDLENSQTEVTYNLNYVHASFETIAGHSSLSLRPNEGSSTILSNSIESITLDLTDYNNNVVNSDIEISVRPKVSVLDFSTFNNETELLDLAAIGMDHVGFQAQYNFLDNSTQEVGHLYINSYADGNGNESQSQNVSGYINQYVSDFSQLEVGLDRLSVWGSSINNEYGNIEIDYNSYDNTQPFSPLRSSGWGEQFVNDEDILLPSNIQINWQDFADLEITNIESGIFEPNADFEIDTYLSDGRHTDATLELSYNLYQYSDYLVDEAADGIDSLKQLAVLGDSVVESSRFVLDINAESLVDDWNIESTDITIQFDPTLFNAIQASDIKIGGALPIANAVDVSELGIIRIAAASLSDLGEGSGIYDMEALASISLDFNEGQIQNLDRNPDGSLKISPLTFDISVNEQETIFSTEYDDYSGQLNREIISLNDLGGSATVRGQEVTLYEAKINLEQQGDGLVLGTERVIGSDASYTNLVRKGDTLTTDATWLNVGNIEANNLTYSAIGNQNAALKSGSFSQSNLASGKFVDGVFEENGRESTTFTADIEITGDAGSVVNMSEGIVEIRANGTTEVFDNQGQGSSNLITFKGDLNYDGRVSMKDLAYLNAGAARQQLIESTDSDGNSVQVASEASYARDVDADFSGKIDLFDLSVLDADWGKTLHIGDEEFQGAADVSWDELDHQGGNTSWDNDSFKDQNATETETDYVGSLEAPGASGVYGSDGNQSQGSLEGEYFQDSLSA